MIEGGCLCGAVLPGEVPLFACIAIVGIGPLNGCPVLGIPDTQP